MGQRDSTYGGDEDVQGVEMHFQSGWGPSPSVSIQECVHFFIKHVHVISGRAADMAGIKACERQKFKQPFSFAKVIKAWHTLENLLIIKWLNSTFSEITSAHLEYVDPVPYAWQDS